MSEEHETQLKRAAEFWDRFAEASPLESPEDQIANGRGIFLLALHLAEAVSAKRISPATLVRELTVDTADDKSFVIQHTYLEAELDTKAMNLVYAGLGVSAIAADAAINPKGQDSADTSDWGSARNIVAQVRNSFAHTPLRPTWEIHKNHRREYSVKAIGLKFDGTVLDRKQFKPDHIGGLGMYFELLGYCLKQGNPPREAR